MEEIKKTPFSAIYDSFFTRVTDDMYMELTYQDTMKMLQDILINALPRFEFPKFNIDDYELGFYVSPIFDAEGNTVEEGRWVGGSFAEELNNQEINILSLSMVIEWFSQQLATTKNARQMYSGPDFKFTSQANHMKALEQMMEKYEQECFHEQRLYSRRRKVNGRFQSTFGDIMNSPNYGYKI